jgi:nitrate/TMAO reductase-like tetraheme cytochrome c subunit
MIRLTIQGIAIALLMGLSPATMAKAPEAGAATAKASAAKAPDASQKCIDCHSEAEPTDKSAAGKPVLVDPAKHATTMHGSGNATCMDCHADEGLKKYPHKSPGRAQCASCHEKAVKEYGETAHGKARAGGNGVAATCSDCHGTHDIKPTSEDASLVSRVNIEKTCAACHGSEALVKQGKVPGGNVSAKYHDSIHGQLLNKAGKSKDKVPVCTDCHGSHDMRPKKDPASAVSRVNIPETCGTCHGKAKKAWSGGQHGKMRAANVMTAPGCTDCHGTHTIADPKTPKWQLDVIGECGGCHTEYIKTYRDTYHGQVTDLGFERMATCRSCHGAHDILPKENPLSMVSEQRILSTCQACHPKANANFVKFQPHANKHSKDSGLILYYTTLFMQLLLAGVFASFGLHTILWLYRSLAEMKAKRARPASESEKH